MFLINEQNANEWAKLGHRDVFGKTLLDLGEQKPETVVLAADLADATRVSAFGKRFPDRFINVGIAEQNMVGVAAGLALGGKMVFAGTFSTFASMRVCEQIRDDLAYQDLPVKIVGIDSGLATGTLGVTHYGLEDIAVLRALPNMTVLVPSDGASLMKLVWVAAEHPGPVYIRLSGGKPTPIIYREERDFAIGGSCTLAEGRHVAVLATGLMVSRALEAANSLRGEGIRVRVIDMYSIKPIDTAAIQRAADETDLIVTAEEHCITGGLGGAVAEVLAERGNAPRLIRIGLPDEFPHAATHETLLERYGLTGAHIAETIRSARQARGRRTPAGKPAGPREELTRMARR